MAPLAPTSQHHLKHYLLEDIVQTDCKAKIHRADSGFVTSSSKLQLAFSSERQDNEKLYGEFATCPHDGQENVDQKPVGGGDTEGCASMLMNGIWHIISNRFDWRKGTPYFCCGNAEYGREQVESKHYAGLVGISQFYPRPSYRQFYPHSSDRKYPGSMWSSPFIGYDGIRSHYLDDNTRLLPFSFQFCSSVPADVTGTALHPLMIRNTSTMRRERTAAMLSLLDGNDTEVWEDEHWWREHPLDGVEREIIHSFICLSNIGSSTDVNTSATHQIHPGPNLDSMTGSRSRGSRQIHHHHHRRMDSLVLTPLRDLGHHRIPFIRGNTGKGGEILMRNMWKGHAQENAEPQTQQHQNNLSAMNENRSKHEGGDITSEPVCKRNNMKGFNSGRHYFQDGGDNISRLTQDGKHKCLKKKLEESTSMMEVSKISSVNIPSVLLEGTYSSLVQKLRDRKERW